MAGTHVRTALAAAVRRRPVAAYAVLAVAASWAYWIPLAVADSGASHIPGLAGPALAGVVVSGVTAGRPGVRDLARRCVRWRVAARWYAVALSPLAVGALALLVLVVMGREMPSVAQLAAFPGLPALAWPAVFVLALVLNGYGEEIGWRGVAWPRLRARHSFTMASAVLAGTWAFWHLPLFWLDTGLGDMPLLTVPGWLVGLAAGTVVLGWLADATRDSILIVALFHTSLNMVSATEASAGLVAAVVSGMVIVLAVTILRRRGGRPADAARHPVGGPHSPV